MGAALQMRRLSPVRAGWVNQGLFIIFILGYISMVTASMIGTRRQSAMARELEQIRLMNKKNHQAERQLQEEEEKKRWRRRKRKKK